MPSTKEKQAEYSKKYYYEHKDQILKKRRQHYKNNAERIKESRRDRYWISQYIKYNGYNPRTNEGETYSEEGGEKD